MISVLTGIGLGSVSENLRSARASRRRNSILGLHTSVRYTHMR